MKDVRFRIRLISGVIAFVALILISKLYILQIVHGSELKEKGDRQYVHTSQAVFDRGSIYFTDKDGNEVSAATLKTGYSIAITPTKIVDPEKVCATIKKSVLELDCVQFVAKASKKGDSYEEITKRIDESEITPVVNAKIPGVIIYKEKWRYYPGDALASQTVGFVAYNKDNLEGRYGVERTYETTLRRTNDNSFTNYFAEMFSNIKKSISSDDSLEGDIVTTIEPSVQANLDETLQAVKEKYNAENAGGIIMNPKNGEIYAMSLRPSFNLNESNLQTNPAIYSNDVVETVKEMGSIIKPLTMAAGIDSGKLTANSTYDDKGYVNVEKSTIYNFDKKGRGTITLQQALGQSLNTGFVYIERAIGKENLAKYFKAFGLGEKTGIDLPNEARGLIDNLNSPREIEYATASFGQGIAFTPVAAARAVAALANGGYLVTPHIAKSIRYSLGYTKDIQYPIGEQVIKQQTSEDITRMLVTDFDQYFQNGKSKNDRYTIAEKTGTAQIALPNGKGYYEDKYLHTFFGYLPAFDSKFLVLLYVTDPKGAQYSSESLGPAFVDLTKFLINYYQIPPDR